MAQVTTVETITITRPLKVRFFWTYLNYNLNRKVLRTKIKIIYKIKNIIFKLSYNYIMYTYKI